MKKIYFILLGSLFFIGSCQKTISDFDPTQNPGQGGTVPVQPAPAGGNFVATINGKPFTFTVTAATLTRSQPDNEKRIDITGTSTDGSKRIILTLGEETYQGNAITVKKYILNAFPEDDPSTPNVDESLFTQGFTTYGIASNGNWVYDIYSENGSCTVTDCNASATLISGNFSTTLTDMNDTTHVVAITAGKITNVKYTVVN